MHPRDLVKRIMPALAFYLLCNFSVSYTLKTERMVTRISQVAYREDVAAFDIN